MKISKLPGECPTCGELALYRVRKDLERGRHGERFIVPGLEFEECDHCGEILFGQDAMEKIELCSRNAKQVG